ncbi:hypothetical protein DORLON_02020 [Dorea longicatena DSM 13814]|uniref:Uncharacterized protein n=1 Tax=Dorea longicatena DSM 13814 TaxID=411462 RepID=A6BI91_9FIRM|nr:hypothetical protein DORLON_02020 [Dorea longicatena DSM 13814]
MNSGKIFCLYRKEICWQPKLAGSRLCRYSDSAKEIYPVNIKGEKKTCVKNVIKENIILQQQSLMHQANRTSVTHTRSCWQMPSQDIKEVRDTMYSSRQEQTNMDRRLS